MSQVASVDIWAITTALASAASAIFAAIVAWISFCQARDFRAQTDSDANHASKLRTFDHTSAASPNFAEAQQKISSYFLGWSTGEPVTFEQAKNAFADKDMLAAFNYVLNHHGRMAAAYEYGLLDKDVAQNLHKFGFLRFWNLFENYLAEEFRTKPSLAEAYANSLKLFEKWRVKGVSQ